MFHAKWNTPIEHTNCFANTNITFTREDGAPGMTEDPKNPLVVSPTINNAKVERTLVDGGSSLNLLLASTLDQTQILGSKIKNISIPFFGIVPRSSTMPIG